MARFKLKESTKELTSYAGLALIGQCLEAVSVDAVLDGRIPVSQGMRTSDLAKSVVGLLSLGKSDPSTSSGQALKRSSRFGTIVFSRRR